MKGGIEPSTQAGYRALRFAGEERSNQVVEPSGASHLEKLGRGICSLFELAEVDTQPFNGLNRLRVRDDLAVRLEARPVPEGSAPTWRAAV